MPTPNQSARPHLHKTIVQLAELFELKKESAEDLNEILHELQCRKTPKAVAMRATVEMAIKRRATSRASGQQVGEEGESKRPTEKRANAQSVISTHRASVAIPRGRVPAIGTSIPDRSYPLHHLSIRVPWHDNGWRGTICNDPIGNTSCLILKSIGGTRNDSQKYVDRGKSLQELPPKQRPCCIGERGHFMAAFEWIRTKEHPYVETSPETHGHFSPTILRHPAFSADAIPFRWMRKPVRWMDEDKENESDFRDRFGIALDPTIEPTLKVDRGWVQHGSNHRALLDCFFGHIKPKESLCFFYAKRTPLSDDHRRVIVGVGRVNHTGDNKEYKYAVPDDEAPLRSLLWERMIQHSIRPTSDDGCDGFTGGFLMPYQQVLLHAIENPKFDPTSLMAFAPDDRREEFSYVAEHVTHDGAIAGLLSCA